MLPQTPDPGQTQAQADSKPLLLFDLNGVLVTVKGLKRGNNTVWQPRPGIHALLRLRCQYRLGIFSSAMLHNVQQALSQVLRTMKASCSEELDLLGLQDQSKGIPEHLVSVQHLTVEQLFQVVLGRPHCIPDPTTRPDKNEWDTVKPLAGNGLVLGRVLLVDNELRKALPEERDCAILIPTWEECPDQGVAAWEQLISSLLMLRPAEAPTMDLRLHTSTITARVSSAAPAEQANTLASPLTLCATGRGNAALLLSVASTPLHGRQHERTPTAGVQYPVSIPVTENGHAVHSNFLAARFLAHSSSKNKSCGRDRHREDTKGREAVPGEDGSWTGNRERYKQHSYSESESRWGGIGEQQHHLHHHHISLQQQNGQPPRQHLATPEQPQQFLGPSPPTPQRHWGHQQDHQPSHQRLPSPQQDWSLVKEQQPFYQQHLQWQHERDLTQREPEQLQYGREPPVYKRGQPHREPESRPYGRDLLEYERGQPGREPESRQYEGRASLPQYERGRPLHESESRHYGREPPQYERGQPWREPESQQFGGQAAHPQYDRKRGQPDYRLEREAHQYERQAALPQFQREVPQYQPVPVQRQYAREGRTTYQYDREQREPHAGLDPWQHGREGHLQPRGREKQLQRGKEGQRGGQGQGGEGLRLGRVR